MKIFLAGAGGVTAIRGKFADGSSLLAIPNYARTNREPAPPQARVAPVTGSDGAVRLPPGPPTSIVWIKEK